MFKTIANAFKSKEIRTKLLITIGLLFLYRLGCWIPIPGINASNITVNDQDFFSLLNGITGNALQNGTLLALGVSPYINASIITQLIGIAIPAVERWSHEGDEGKRKMSNFTRIITLLIAIAQSIGIAIGFATAQNGVVALDVGPLVDGVPVFVVGMFVVVILVAGSIFTMWLGEKITDAGVGNGISLLIFIGIISTAGQAIVSTVQIAFGQSADAQKAPWELVIFLALIVVIFGFITFIDMSERRVPVQYAKQIKGRKQYGGQSTHIPIKVNASGVLPIIFSTALVSFPQMVMSMFLPPDNEFLRGWNEIAGTGTILYFVINGLLILFFSYFYAQIQFKPDEVSRNLQQYGGFIPGIRPGKPTAEYLGKVSKRLTLFGAIYLAVIFIVPSVIMSWLAMAQVLNSMLLSAFTSTGMLIVVSVALEFEKQLESQLMMKQYKGFLK